jgi:hypothetical protein
VASRGDGNSAQLDRSYRAIGRYFCEFSQLVAGMRVVMTRRLATDPPILGELVFGFAGAGDVAEVLFAMCRAVVADFTKQEEKIESALRLRVMKETRWRNDLAHGDWWPRSIAPETTLYVARIRPPDGNPSKVIPLTADDLNKRSDDVGALANLVTEFATLCFHDPPYEDATIRVGDILAIRDKAVVRDGSRVKDFPDVRFARGFAVI